MKSYLTSIALAFTAMLFFSCDRERSNPIDPQSSVLAERPTTPTGLVAQDDVGRIVIGWQPVEEGDLAGYGIYRANQSNGTYEFIPGDGDSTLFITTGKTSFIDSLDTPGTTFFYRVTAIDTVGLISLQSNFVGATVLEDLVPPETPLNLSVVASEDSNDRIVVRWTPPRIDSDGSELSGLAGFVVFRAENSTGFVAIDTLAGDAQELVDEGLKALTTYAYRIMAFDAAGNSSPLTAPQQTETRGLQIPFNLAASGQIERIEIAWNGIDNLDLLGYNVFRSTRADEGFELMPSVEGSDFTTGKTAYIDSNLTGGQVFFYKVQAVGANNLQSEMSSSVSAEVLADELAPAAPLDISAVPGEDNFNQVQVSWNPPTRDAAGGALTGVSGYIVYRSEETNTSFVAVGQVDADTHVFLDQGVAESTVYFYAVTAVDAAANEGPRTSPIQIRTKGPDKVAPQAPQNVSAVPSADDFGQITVRWSPAVLDADNTELTGLANYIVFRSEGSINSFVPVATLGPDAREFVDSGLDPLTTYFYTVSALDDAGNEGPRAITVQVRTEGPDRIAPGAPSNVSAVASEVDFGQVTVRWSPVIGDADGGELTGLFGYVVFRAEGSSSFVPVDTVQADVREYIDTGLRPLTGYSYRVLAFDESGNESAVSNTAQTQTMGVPVPLNLAAVAGIGRIELAWQAVEELELLGYNVYRSTQSDQGYELLPSADGGAFTTGHTTYIDSSRTEGEQFFYKVQAVVANGQLSELSGFVGAIVLGDQVAPDIPRNLSAVPDPVNFGQVVLTWSPVLQETDGTQLASLQGYAIFRSKDTNTAFVQIATVAGDITEFTDTGLDVATTYFYSVTAIDPAGNESARPNPVQVRTEGPDQIAPQAPSNVSAVADEVDFGRVVVRWSPSVRDADNGDLTGLQSYIVFRSKGTANAFVPVDTLAASARQFEDQDLSPLTIYFYTVSALDGNGNESARANPVQVQTEGPDQVAPQSPSNLSAVPDEINFGQITVRWSPSVRDADNGDLTGLQSYIVFRSKGTANSFVPVATLDASAREFVDTGLDELTTYFYTISATDPSGNESARANPVQVRTEGPDQIAPQSPSNLSAVADEVDFGQVVVRWSPSVRDADNGDLTGLQSYIVFRSKGTANSFVPVDTLDASAREFVDRGLDQLTTYFYTVTATDPSGNESARATAVQVRTEGPDQIAPQSPSNLSAVADEVDFGQVVVRWSPSVRDADNGDLTGLQSYIVFRSKGTANSFVPVDTLDASAREFVDRGLDQLTTYFYTVTATDPSGNESARATAVQVRTEGPDQIAPQSPSNLSAVADEVDFGRVVVRWSPSVRDADNGDLTGLQSYIVFRSKGTANSFVPVDTLAASAREYEDLNLNPLTDYFYTVTAIDEAGNESARATAVQVRTEGPDQVAPETPQNVSAVPDEVDFGRVVVSWSPSVTDVGGGDLTGLAGYVVFRSKGSVNAFVPVDTLAADARQFADSGLEPLTTYFYTLMAFDEAGNESGRATSVQVLTDGPDQVAPAAPADLAATADFAAAQITVSWSPPSADADGGDLTGLATYIVLRSKDDASSFAAIDTLSSSSTSFVDSGLESSTTYFYAVRAADDAGNASSRSASISATTAGIAVPTGVAAAGDIRQVTVSWNSSSDENLLGFNVYRSTRSDQGYTRLVGVEGTSYTTGQTAYIDSGLTGGATFFYRISTVTSTGESDQSAFAGATVDSDTRAPAAPTFVDGEPVTGDPESLNITWKPPTTDLNGATLTGLSSYLVYRADTSSGPFDLVGTSTTTAFVDTGLTAVTTYFYQIEASDQEGNLSNRSTTVALTTGGVDIPSNVRLSSSTPSNIAEAPTVTITWDGSAGAILHYEVQRTTVANSTDDADFTSIEPNTLDTTRDDNTVSRGTTYYYRVRARDVDDRVSDWTTLAQVDVKN